MSIPEAGSQANAAIPQASAAGDAPSELAPETQHRLPLTIAILSFNRSEYLSAVLQSLRPQLTEHDEVLLFQDGGWNPYIRAVKAQELEIDRCVEAFNDISAPGKGAASPIFRAFRSHVNNGIALNYWMAETYVFDVLKKPYALFLEDDLLLSSNYLSVTSDLIGMALKNKRIGYVSAYGNFWASLEDQNRNQESLVRMHESWGFATTYDSWKAQIAIRNAYLTLVSGCDYRFRNQQAIMTLYEKLGYKCHYTTQDSARWVACHAAGMVRLTPYTCHARYIGAVGEHCTGLHYKKYGFDRAAFFPVKPALRAPSEEEIDDWYRADTENFKNGYEHYYVSQAGANV